MPLPDDAPVTEWLIAWGQGDQLARERLMEAVYGDLRRRAAAFLRRERQAHTLQPTALVHEAYLRLGDGHEMKWENKRHFFIAAATAMRRILVERARRKAAAIHGGRLQRIDLDQVDVATETDGDLLLLVDEALTALAERDPTAAELIKLRFFVGLPNVQAAEVLGVPERTAKRSWAYARAWLYREIQKKR